jgi:hypothetical protein
MIKRVEREMNLVWAEANPALFVKSLQEFQRQYAIDGEWRVEIELSRKGFITLIAHNIGETP